MNIARYINLSSIFLIVLLLCMSSCTDEVMDLSNLNDTLYVRNEGADMPAYIHGNASEKKFLIILHGGPGGHGLQYRANTIQSMVEQHCAVVYFDQRGSGLSQGSYSAEEVSVDLMADDVIALAKVIKHKYGAESKLYLMGHSWGGTLGPATLLKDQSLFAGWIDAAGAHDPSSSYLQYLIAIREMADEQIMLSNSVDFWTEAITTIESVAPTYNLEDFQTLNRLTHNAEKRFVADDLVDSISNDDTPSMNEFTALANSLIIQQRLNDNDDLFGSITFSDRLHEITLPSLILWGRYDLIVPLHYGKEALEKLGSSDKELIIFERSGHSMMFNEPVLFAEKVIGFLEG